MSQFEITGASALARGSPNEPQNVFSARSGAGKARAIQSTATATAAAPVETSQAVAQTQSAEAPRLTSERPPLSHVSRPGFSLSKPMTAVLLHELRLQQELADVQEEKGKKES